MFICVVVILLKISVLHFLLPCAGCFGGAYDYVVAIFAEGFFVTAMFDEEGVTEAGDVEEHGACGEGGLAGGVAEQGGGLFVEGFGFSGEAVGFVALDFGLGGFVHRVGNRDGTEKRSGAALEDDILPTSEVARTAGGNVDADGFACHKERGSVDVLKR